MAAVTPSATPDVDGPGDALGSRERPVILRYGVAVVVAVIAVAAQVGLERLLGTDAPFLVSFFSIVVAGLYGGLGPGLCATLLAAGLVEHFVLPRNGSAIATNLVVTGLFVLVASGIVAMTEALHRARRRAEAGQAALLSSYQRLATAQRRAVDSEGRFRLAADRAPVMLWTTGPDKLCDWVNRPWLEFRGRTMAQELGNGWVEGVHPDDVEHSWATYSTAFDARQPFVMDYRLKRHDGEYRWTLDHGVPRLVDGVFEGYIGSCLDIHDRREAEDERERLLAEARDGRDAAQRANRAKDEFLATVSHELRTPLNAVLSWAQLLQTGLAPDRLGSGLDTIVRNARLQAQLIDDLLDLSRIVSGKMRLRLASVDFAVVVQAAVETARPGAEGKGVALAVDAAAGIAHVVADVDRLQQVIWNLLSHAVKFTAPGGRVEVRLTTAESTASVMVRDSGIGIRPAEVAAIFEPFRQGDDASRRQHGGLGLGLAIVRHLVELHGGSVEASSDGEGRGATLRIHLPLAPSGIEEPVAKDDPPLLGADALAGVGVLVVEDDPDALTTVRILLEAHGAAVVSATTAAEGYARLRERRPDVLIADIGLPGENGYDLMRRVRALSREAGGDVPAAALTAFARPEDRQLALLAGFQQHLAKPAALPELVAIVARLAGRGVATELRSSDAT